MAIEQTLDRIATALEAIANASDSIQRSEAISNAIKNGDAAPSTEQPAKRGRGKAAPKSMFDDEPKKEEPKKEEVKDDLDDDLGNGLDDDLDDDLGASKDMEYTFDQVREALLSVRDKVSRDKAREIMSAVGAKSVDAIGEDKYAQVIDLCKKATK